MAQAWWETLEQVSSPLQPAGGAGTLLLQRGTYHFYDGSPAEDGYRFIWRVNGKLQARPARIVSLAEFQALISSWLGSRMADGP